MMTRISSLLTWYFQYVLLFGGVFILGLNTLGILFGKFSDTKDGQATDNSRELIFFAPLMLALVILIFGFLFLRLRRVYYDVSYLYLYSSFGKKLIPHSQVMSFHAVRFVSPQFYVMKYFENGKIHSVLLMPRFPFLRATFGNRSIEQYESFKNNIKK